jgi:geranylgeranyl pyrophosphate synthase
MLTDPLALIRELGGDELSERLAAVEVRLLEVGEPSQFARATISAGGKRLRPLLIFLAGLDCGEQAALVRAAVSIELVHAATLVHDDVLDNAPLRRGSPSVFALAGRDGATQTGDFLFSRAFAELAANASVEQLQTLSRASSALSRGELLQREDAYNTEVGVERYLERCRLKTSALFEAACELGSLICGAPALGGFGRDIGLAFQVLDDVLDISGPVERTGKARGTDLLDGTVTLPLIYGRRLDPALAALSLREIADPEAVCDLLVECGALEQARAFAQELVARAKRELPQRGISERRRRGLELVADGVVARFA